MKIVFMGSAAFAVPSLDALLQKGHEVSLVVTQCDKPAGRGLKVHSCPVAAFANSKRLPLFQPKTLKDENSIMRISEAKPQLVAVVAYGKFLPKALLELAPHRAINVHASLLPKYRGAAPINWAIAKGETITGVTTMMVGKRMDAGDILLQKEAQIGPEETAIELHDCLAAIGAELLIETIDGIEKKKIRPRPQEDAEATLAPILKKEDGLIDWKKQAREIFNLIRGMQPWPVAYTHLDGKVLRIFGAKKSDEKINGAPGTVVSADKNLAVATGERTLYLLEVQLEGKKRMTADSFLRGHKIAVGTILGNAATETQRKPIIKECHRDTETQRKK
jgi:methionyl-tRNA formyltransferase